MVIVNMTEDFPVGILCAKKLFCLRTTFESEFLLLPKLEKFVQFFHTDSRYIHVRRAETKVAFGEQKRPLLMKI